MEFRRVDGYAKASSYRFVRISPRQGALAPPVREELTGRRSLRVRDTPLDRTKVTSADSLAPTSRKPGTFASNFVSRSASARSSILSANRIGPFRCCYSSNRSLTDRQRNVLGLIASTQSKRNVLAHTVRPKRAQDRSNVADGLIIPGDDDVALVYARFGARSLRLDIHHHYTSFAALDRDMLETEAEIATRECGRASQVSPRHAQ